MMTGDSKLPTSLKLDGKEDGPAHPEPKSKVFPCACGSSFVASLRCPYCLSLSIFFLCCMCFPSVLWACICLNGLDLKDTSSNFILTLRQRNDHELGDILS